MMMNITFNEKIISSNLYQAVSDALEDGHGTADIINDESLSLSTTEFTNIVKEKYLRILTK